MAGSVDRLLGRDRELASIEDFLDHRASPALVIRGEPGIGKTALWETAKALASARGYDVRSAKPTESEAKLSYAGLGDLLGDLDDATVDRLPDPQRWALEVALLRAEAPAGGVDRRTVSVAALAALRIIARAAPIVLAVDDLQWLDNATAQVLQFVVRRLEDDPIRLIVSLRHTADRRAGARTLRLFGDDNVSVIDLGGLSDRSLNELLRTRLETGFPRPTLDRIVEASAGNPYFSLEIARALLSGRLELEPSRPLRVPNAVADLLPNHIARLPSTTRSLLLMASAASVPTISMMMSALGDPDQISTDLMSAEAAGIVELEGDRIRFTHPLLSSAVYRGASPSHRREVHRRLAEIVSDPEERARHSALGADRPDPDVAAALDSASRTSQARGAPGAAAELAELAERLTPPDRRAEAGARALWAGRCFREAGDQLRARDSLERAVDKLPPGADRASALVLIGYVEMEQGNRRGSEATFGRAWKEATGDPNLLSDVEQGLAWLAGGVDASDLRAATKHARAAVSWAELGADPVMQAEALATLAYHESGMGRGIRIDLLDLAAFDPKTPHLRVTYGSRWILGSLFRWIGDLDAARDVLEGEITQANLRGDGELLAIALAQLVLVEMHAGDWPNMAALARRYWEAVGLAGPNEMHHVERLRACIDCLVGDIDAARSRATHELLVTPPGSMGEIELRSTLGLLELSLGRAAEAHAQLGDLFSTARAIGLGEPARMSFVTDEIEALIALRDLDRAESRLRWFERAARRLDRPLALATAARCRGLLHAAKGNLPATIRSLERALKQHERAGQPFELARTELAMGEVRRRARQTKAARASLELARTIFQGLGARIWIERTERELASIPGRRPSRDVLTSTEAKVAHLAAAGKRSREIADELFISVRTVEGHLSHVYAKLGVRSRTELATALEADDDAVIST